MSSLEIILASIRDNNPPSKVRDFLLAAMPVIVPEYNRGMPKAVEEGNIEELLSNVVQINSYIFVYMFMCLGANAPPDTRELLWDACMREFITITELRYDQETRRPQGEKLQ